MFTNIHQQIIRVNLKSTNLGYVICLLKGNLLLLMLLHFIACLKFFIRFMSWQVLLHLKIMGHGKFGIYAGSDPAFNK